MKPVFSAGVSGFLVGVGVIIGVVIGGLLLIFFLKWYLGTIDLKEIIISSVLR